MGFWGGVKEFYQRTPGPIGAGINIYEMAKGRRTPNPLMNIMGEQFGAFDESIPLATRPPIGAMGAAAAQQQSQAMQQMLNQQLTQSIIPAIGREWGGAERFMSGRRQEAVGQAFTGAQTALSTAMGQSAMQRYIAELQAQMQRESLEEREARFQAQLDVSGQESDEAALMEYGKLLMMLYGGGGA